MHPFKEKRAYTLQRDFCVLEREKRVTKILGSHAFRTELEGILQGQLDGSRSPPKPSHALSSLQENVAPASAVEAASRGPAGSAAASSVIPINDLRGARSSRYVLPERQLRCKLASLCRLVDWFRWSQLVDNHVSARGVGERGEFLVNPFGLLYSEVTASSLVRVSVEEGGSIVDGGSTRLGVNRAGLELHSAIYGARRDVHCIMHLHTVAGAAVSVMSCGLLPISEEALSVGKVAYYDGRRPLTGHRERKEFTKALGKNKVLILRNHGLVAVGNCMEECFHIMYNLIQACKIQVAAVSAGLANLTQLPLLGGEGPSSGGREESVGMAAVWSTKGQMEFEALMRMLDKQGYQTGYRYRGLSLLEAGGDSSRAAVWEEVVEGGERDTARRLQQRRDLKERAKKSQKEPWAFLDDNRARDKPLTKNTKIRVRVGQQGEGGVSPVEEEETESGGDPWQFLTSRESSVLSPDSKAGSRPSTAQRLANTSGGSGTPTTEDHLTSSLSHHHNHLSVPGRRRARRKKKSSSTSSRTPTPSAGLDSAPPYHQTPPPSATSNYSHTAPAAAGVTTSSTTLPPLDLTTLEETAERVAHSTGLAVQKLSLKRTTGEEGDLGRAHSDPNFMSTWGDLTPSNQDPRDYYHRRHLLVDSQGYSSGDEASYYLGSPHRPAQAERRSTTPPLATSLHPSPLSHTTSPHPITLSDESTPHTSHTHPPSHRHPPPPTHNPADINYPDGWSSAEKAVHVARLVADSTGSAIQKLSETMATRQQVSQTRELSTTVTHTAEI